MPRLVHGAFMGTVIRFYGSFSEFLAEIHKHPVPANLRSGEELGSDWAGCYSLAEAIGLAERGWPEGCERREADRHGHPRECDREPWCGRRSCST